MLSGIGVSGRIIMGTVLKLENSQMAEMESYLEKAKGNIVLVASELSVKDAMKLENYPVAGIVTEKGGSTSHLAIWARKQELTAILGVPGSMLFLKTGDEVLLDGQEGNLLVSPRQSTVEQYQKMQKQREERQSMMDSYAEMPTVTADGCCLKLMANIDGPEDVDKVTQCGGEGIGLFRTENIFTQKGCLPTEEEQFDVYVEASKKMNGATLTIRTLDAGGEHPLSYLNLEEEANPFLGCRGIRFSLRRPDIFKTQCRAILRASAYGKFRILLPMLSSLMELRRAKNVISLIKEELDESGISYDHKIQVGVMIETPAAVWLADLFVKEADFLSIGTNDLTQYTVAADRSNKQVSKIYSNYHPAVLRSICSVLEKCRQSDCLVTICGEAAGDEKVLPLFLLYGVKELSVSPGAILKTRRFISQLSLDHYSGLADEIFTYGTIEEAESCLDRFYKKYEKEEI